MIIKVAVFDNDPQYLERLCSVLSSKYADQMLVFSFTNLQMALNSLDENKIDVFLATEDADIDIDALPKRCGFAYFVDGNNIESVKDQPAISKFQKIDLIYKQILSIYSEHSTNVAGNPVLDSNCSVIAFTSPVRGAGSSTMAAAFAISSARAGKSVLYLSLEDFAATSSYFHADGQFTMSDIIYAVKSKKVNMSLKIESCVRQDSISGVYFFESPKVGLDMLEMTLDDKIDLINALRISGMFQTIVVDFDFTLGNNNIKFMQTLPLIILVNDGSEVGNLKMMSIYESLVILDGGLESSLLNRMQILYNKFSSKSGVVLDEIGLKLLGGIPKYENATAAQIVQQVANMNTLAKLI